MITKTGVNIDILDFEARSRLRVFDGHARLRLSRSSSLPTAGSSPRARRTAPLICACRPDSFQGRRESKAHVRNRRALSFRLEPPARPANPLHRSSVPGLVQSPSDGPLDIVGERSRRHRSGSSNWSNVWATMAAAPSSWPAAGVCGRLDRSWAR